MSGEQGPAIVQLQKWGLQVKLAQFLEAFLSPTRELILLLSHHHEGLFLPLAKGIKLDDQIISNPRRMFSLQNYVDSYPMLSDVISLAWGICDHSNNEASFRELLFVVGNHGLTVHAFCQPSQSKESIEAMPDGQNGEGMWVEWGPRDAIQPDENGDTFLESGDEMLEPKKWLKTFLTKVKTVKSQGKLHSRFPDKSQYPSSSKVVSFNIFEYDSTLLRFIFEVDQMNISYKCCRVFVNNLHDLIGFVLTWNTHDRKQGKNVVVGKVVSWGIQWVCSVKLDEDVYMVPTDQWTDFKFLDNYLICLSSSGHMHFFVDITGAYVGHVNLLEIFKLSSDLVGKSVFRTLVAARTSLLAVVDDYGIAYVTRANDLLSEINEKSLPLVGWEVGGADISQQRLSDNLSPNMAFVMERKDKTESNESGFSASPIVGQKINHSALRSIFLPTDKYSKDDVISLSPFGITRLHRNNTKRISQIIHFNLHFDPCSNEVSVADAVGCMFHGCFYLVTAESLSVVLPSISVSSGCIPVEAIGFRQVNWCLSDQSLNLIEIKRLKQPWPTWKLEVLDRVLLYEGHEEADHLCSENGWDLKVSRMRRLQLALDYLNFQEVKISLEKLAGVSLAEEGVLRLVFAAVYLMLNKGGNDNDVSAASRLLSLGIHFSTKMIRSYGSLRHMQNEVISGLKESSLPLLLADKEHNETENSTRLQEMARLLEIIRNMQCRLASKFKKSITRLGDGLKPLEFVDAEDDLNLSSMETTNEQDKHALKSLDTRSYADLEASISQAETSFTVSFENPKDMIARWELDHLDHKGVVKDALLSGRLPLAVLKLHLYNQQGKEELHDTFEKVRDIGRAIAYDLFLKGEIELGLTTLQKLGEDLESCLRQLVFGTVRRSLRKQITQVMKIYGYLGPYESKILEGISFIERVYPCSSFSGTFCAQQKTTVCDINYSPEEVKLSLISDKLTIQCGELDGVVLGFWRHVSKHPTVIDDEDEDDTHDSYWAAAAVWSDAWDQRIIDRIVLDRLSLMDTDVSWESQFEYHMSHSNWEEASRLIDIIPSYSSSHGNLRISLDGLPTGIESEFGNYIYSIQDLDAVYMDIPDIKILGFPSINTSSIWLKSLVESQLAKKFIFLKEFWEGTEELVCLLARSGFVTNMLFPDKSTTDLYFTNFDDDIITNTSFQGLHKLFLHHCIQLNLPNLLDLYLDHHKLSIDPQLLSALLEAALMTLLKEQAKWQL